MSIIGLCFTQKNLHFKKGEFVFKEHDVGDELYFIHSGRIKIAKLVGDTEAVLSILNEGDFFGEMSLITGSKRIASAIAQTNCKLHTMDRKTFEHNLSNNKNFMKKILESLAFRLEETDKNIKHYIQRIFRLYESFHITG